MLFTTSRDLKAREADELRRVELYGPAPINPFQALRVHAGMSLGDLAVHSKVDERALSRLEDGLYATPLPTVVAYWVHYNHDESDLVGGYEAFQLGQRRRHKHYFGENLNPGTGQDHPFRVLRRWRPSLVTNEPLPVGLVEVSRALCVPLDTVQFFEKKWKIQQSVPKNIKSALYQMHYTMKQISNFEEIYKEWRKSQVSSAVLS